MNVMDKNVKDKYVRNKNVRDKNVMDINVMDKLGIWMGHFKDLLGTHKRGLCRQGLW